MNPSLERLVRTLLWSETDNSDESGGEPLDANYDITDVDEKSLAELNKRFQSFVEEAEKALTEKFGDEWSSIDDFYTGSASDGFYTEHDFILTANGHGCGFWEKGDWQDGVGDILTKLAKKQGEINAYVGDDGKVYFSFNYSPKILPGGFEWAGAIAGSDGYNGHAYVLNVAKDGDGTLWCFGENGRFRICPRMFESRKISDRFLPALPLSLSPDD